MTREGYKPSEPREGSSQDQICPTCLNIDSQLWRDRVQANCQERLSSTEQKARQAHLVPLRAFQRSREGGCRFCGLICAVIAWNQNGPAPEDVTLLLPGASAERGISVMRTDGPCNIFRLPSQDSNWNYIPQGQALPDAPGAEESFDFVRQQLRDCHMHHAECRAAPGGISPKRLVSVGLQDEELLIVTSDPFTLEIPQYAALSYCWGKDQEFKFTKDRGSIIPERYWLVIALTCPSRRSHCMQKFEHTFHLDRCK